MSEVAQPAGRRADRWCAYAGKGKEQHEENCNRYAWETTLNWLKKGDALPPNLVFRRITTSQAATSLAGMKEHTIASLCERSTHAFGVFVVKEEDANEAGGKEEHHSFMLPVGVLTLTTSSGKYRYGKGKDDVAAASVATRLESTDRCQVSSQPLQCCVYLSHLHWCHVNMVGLHIR